MKRLVIFDLDGTLLDTLGDIRSAVNYSLGKMGKQERTLEEIRSFIGNGTKTLLESALGEPHSAEDIRECFAHYSEYYSEHYADHTLPYEGIRECVDRLIGDGIACAVVTNKLHEVSSELCRRFFEGCFVEVIGDLPNTPRKPDPGKVLDIISKTGADKAIYVGDSYVDVLTAKNAGITGVMLTWGFDSRDHLVEVGAKYLVNDASELYKVIDRLFENNVD
jgi:phosphoglycolate phosphatase